MTSTPKAISLLANSTVGFRCPCAGNVITRTWLRRSMIDARNFLIYFMLVSRDLASVVCDCELQCMVLHD